MKRIYTAILFFSLGAVLLVTGCGKAKTAGEETKETELVIYAYDSFVSEWGPGPKVFPIFEKKYGVKIQAHSVGDAGQVMAKAMVEKANPQADLVIGLDNNMLATALKEGILIPYKSPLLKGIADFLIFDKTHHLTPFDYGYFSIVYDSKKITDPPNTMEALTKPEFKKSLILMDPRTSSPGLGFLLQTVAVYGKNYLDYWKRLKPSILTITDGWSAGYGLFTQGEAPLVLSYTTSPAYHVEFENSRRYKTVIFKEGNYLQVEGAGVLKGAKHMRLAKLFVDFMLSAEFQKEIPLTNWMFPVREDIPLPASFQYALKPAKVLQLNAKDIETNLDKWIQGWVDLMSQ